MKTKPVFSTLQSFVVCAEILSYLFYSDDDLRRVTRLSTNAKRYI